MSPDPKSIGDLQDSIFQLIEKASNSSIQAEKYLNKNMSVPFWEEIEKSLLYIKSSRNRIEEVIKYSNSFNNISIDSAYKDLMFESLSLSEIRRVEERLQDGIDVLMKKAAETIEKFSLKTE